jgi:pimeloyl-ACP methyl ester carboxylesterase
VSSEAEPTLVLVHAFPMGAAMWDPQRSAAPGWRIVTPSLPGFDGRPQVADCTMSGYTRDLIDTLDRLHIERAVFGGLSLGGYVLFELLRQAPGKVAGLILADTRTSIDAPERLAARERSIARARSDGARAIADDMLPGILGPTTRAERPAVVAEVRRLIESQPAETIVAGLTAIMTRADSAEILPASRVPATIIVGDEDVITPLSDASFMHQRIAGSTLVTIPGAGHMSNLEAPDAFNAAMQALLLRCALPR